MRKPEYAVRVLSLVVAVLMVLFAGCAKQAVRSESGAPAPGAAGGPAGGPAEGTAPGGIAAETITPEPGSAAARAGEPSARSSAAETRMAAAGIAATEEKKSPFGDIHFDFNKSFIRDEDKPALAAIADRIRKNHGKFLIEGHCDERGTSEYNMALGERRAESARAYLVSLGVPKGALSTVSFGKEKPVDSGHNESAWAKNRRAHFVVR